MTPMFTDIAGDGTAEIITASSVVDDMTTYCSYCGPTWPYLDSSMQSWELPTRYTHKSFPWEARRGQRGCNAFVPVPIEKAIRIVDLAENQQDLIVYGEDAGDQLGFHYLSRHFKTLSTADIDGDTIDDLIMGAPGGDGYENLFSEAGEVNIFWGRDREDWPISIDLSAVASDLLILGEMEGGYFGSSISTGNINNDRWSDIIVSAPFIDHPLTDIDFVGAVYIFYGKERSDFPSIISLETTNADVTIIGGEECGYLGTQVLTGNFDGDDFDDLLLYSLPAYDDPWITKGFLIRGSHIVELLPEEKVYLDVSPEIIKTTILKQVDIGPPLTEEYCGMVLGNFPHLLRLPEPFSKGDINADGYDDIIIGSPDVDRTGRPWSGVVDVFLGREEVEMPLTIDLRIETGDIQILGADLDDWLGVKNTSGDVNGDGVEDIIASSIWGAGPMNSRPCSGEIAVVFGSSDWSLISLPDPVDLASATESEAIRIYAPFDRTILGASVAATYINDDNLSDIIVSGISYFNGPIRNRVFAGEIYVILSDGFPESRDLAAELADILIYGASTGDSAGWCVSDGDISSDGLGDILVTIPGGDGPTGARESAGEIAVVYGWR